ncbi:MAG: type II secretion system protein [Sphaerospermopsis sp. SIO1G2]|nr:type II secretion system protein [Sphaerospermopsis sp. SIO1G2]
MNRKQLAQRNIKQQTPKPRVIQKSGHNRIIANNDWKNQVDFGKVDMETNIFRKVKVMPYPQSSVLSPQFNGRQSAVKTKKTGFLPRRMTEARAAFSLVELSVVLVILGLLAGGILAGQSLIRAAELRKITTEQNQIFSSIYQFRDRYGSIPGDFDINTAAQLWQTETGCTSGNDGNTTPRLNYTQCGSDCPSWGGCKNGLLEDSWEQVYFWRHLQLDGLFQGVDTTPNAATTTPEVHGKHLPFAPMNGVWWMRSDGATNNRNWLRFSVFGAEVPLNWGFSGMTRFSILNPEEAWGIDKKTDDSLPLSGSIIADTGFNNSGDCEDIATNEYNLGNTGTSCIIDFVFK